MKNNMKNNKKIIVEQDITVTDDTSEIEVNPQSMTADSFLQKLKQDLGFEEYTSSIVEFQLKGNKIPGALMKELFYIGLSKHEMDGMEGLWPIRIGMRYGTGSPWNTVADEMERELENKRDGDKIFEIKKVKRGEGSRVGATYLSFEDAVIPSTAFFEFIKKFVDKFKNLANKNSFPIPEGRTKKVVKLTESDLRNIVQQVLQEQEKQNILGKAKNLLDKLMPKLPAKLKDAFNKTKQSGNIEPLMALVPANKKEEVLKKALELSKNPTKIENEINKLPVSEQVGLGWTIVWVIMILLAIYFLFNPNWDRVYYGTDFNILGQIDFDYQ